MINDRSDTSTKTQKKKICNSAVDIYQEQKLHILILQIDFTKCANTQMQRILPSLFVEIRY